jgi:hypothetical protein
LTARIEEAGMRASGAPQPLPFQALDQATG